MSLSQTTFSLQSLNSVHHELNELFIRHQMLLMHREISSALRILHELHDKYRVHIYDEESLMLPLYQNKIKPTPPGGAVEFYRHEHRKIEQFLKRFIATVSDWQKKGTFSPLRLVELFDRHYTFKDLLKHHHAREDTFLYRLLDRRLEPQERQALFQKICILPNGKASPEQMQRRK